MRWRISGRLTPAAATLTSTSPFPGFGVGRLRQILAVAETCASFEDVDGCLALTMMVDGRLRTGTGRDDRGVDTLRARRLSRDTDVAKHIRRLSRRDLPLRLPPDDHIGIDRAVVVPFFVGPDLQVRVCRRHPLVVIHPAACPFDLLRIQ